MFIAKARTLLSASEGGLGHDPTRLRKFLSFAMKMKCFVETFLICFFAVTPVVGAATVSISQPTFTGLADYSPEGFGQSFTANGDYSIIAIELYISASAGGSDATLRIYDFNSSLPALGASVLGSGTFLEADLNSAPQWVRVELVSPVVVTNGSEYAFTVVAKDPGGSATGWNNYGVSSSNVYSGGARIDVAPVFLKTSDLAFRVVTVPEPSVWMISSIGLLLGVNCRTRRAS